MGNGAPKYEPEPPKMDEADISKFPLQASGQGHVGTLISTHQEPSQLQSNGSRMVHSATDVMIQQ